MTITNKVYLQIILSCVFLSFSLSAQTQVKILAADGAAGDEFGYEISTYGNYSIIGALRDDDMGENSGSAYIYLKTGDAIAQEAKLTASDGIAGALFGRSVSIYGTECVIGSPGKSTNGTNSGGTYVFRKNVDVWEQVANLYPADGLQTEDNFGWSVSIYGNYLVASSMKDNDLQPSAGAIYFFRKIDGNWVQMGKHYASDGDFGDQFGRCVSLYGDYCAIGAPYNAGNGTYCGAVYIYKRNGDAWYQTQKIVPEDGAEYDDFGLSVSLFNNILVVGSSKDDDLGSNSGSVYIYNFSGGTFSFITKILPSLGGAGDYFGYSLKAFNNRIIVGAPQIADTELAGDGYSTVFTLIDNNWVEEMVIKATDGQANDAFGWATSLADGYGLIGAKFDDDKGSNAGSAYMYILTPVPVELTSFSGEAAGGCVLLNWATATELNNSGFEIQRRSSDAGFDNVGFVKGTGTSSEVNNYRYADCDLPNGLYTYRLKQVDVDGTFVFSDEINIKVGNPETYYLGNNYPNPFNPSTNIVFSIPEKMNVKIKIYNVLGVEVLNLVDGVYEQGEHSIVFNAEGLASGVYLYKIIAGKFSETKKMMLVR